MRIGAQKYTKIVDKITIIRMLSKRILMLLLVIRHDYKKCKKQYWMRQICHEWKEKGEFCLYVQHRLAQNDIFRKFIFRGVLRSF